MAITHAGQPWETTPQRFLTHLPFPARALDAARAERLLAAARRSVEAKVKDAGRRRDLLAALGKALAAYRASDASEATIAADLARVGDWARRHGVPARRVLLGEFGVFQDEADPAARLAILKATRKAAEKQGFLWAVYTAGLTKPNASFGVIAEARTLAVDPAVRIALGLAP